MTTWTCVRCGRPADESRLRKAVVDGMAFGRCFDCRADRTFLLDVDRCVSCGEVIQNRAHWESQLSAYHSYIKSGETLKQRGMAAVETAEGIQTTWVDRADAAIAQLAQRGTPFSAEDVASIAGRPDHPNSVGARMNAAARRGVIEWTGEIVTANRPERHASALRLWRGAAA